MIEWLRNRAPNAFNFATNSLLKELINSGSDRISAVRLTSKVALGNDEFVAMTKEGDLQRDTHSFASAEFSYFKALRLFPLHNGYRVQYAHMLKEQAKFADAVIQYWFALNIGAPQADVEEHLLFAARRADLPVGPAHIAQSAAAWAIAEQTTDEWAMPPFETDFNDFADIFWGSRGYLNEPRLLDFLITCSTRKELFLAFLKAPETARHNRQLLLMLNRVGLSNVQA